MKIGIVNDMRMSVEALRRVVVTVPDYEVVWVAQNGVEAVAMCAANRPDLILMDLVMPVMDGVEATRRIMEKTPCAILVVSATVEGNISKVFDAMGCGALDAVCTPVLGKEGMMTGGEGLLAKIRTIGKLMAKPKARTTRIDTPRPSVRTRGKSLVALGASTGGPQAVAEILGKLPADFRPAIVIIQHVDVMFAPGLVDWLNHQSKIKVRLARNGDVPEPNSAWLACSNDHLIITADLSFQYTPIPTEYPYRPSVDVFFESAARYWPGTQVAALLTGMGRDGSRGLLSLRQRGWHTIAQDEKSCIVYGMPKAAVALNAASEVLHIKSIAERLTQLCTPAT
ncbi:MAG: chemotaxis response regulator protein-glutamate methylesterase [Planctomycetota bacterium]|nr:chemotaxis response regulator protein-glutamate methylesterase [Planctomycetota bacterium]